jgi:hypothetical protein
MTPGMTPGNKDTATTKPAPTTKRSPSRKPAAKPAAKSVATKKAPPGKPGPKPSAEKRPRTATVNLPFVTAEFRAPDVHMPSVGLPHPSLAAIPVVRRVPTPHVPEAAGRQVTDAARVVRSYLPERGPLALFAGLGAAAATGIINWPVAGAVAAGTLVAQRSRRSAESQSRPSEKADTAKSS